MSIVSVTIRMQDRPDGPVTELTTIGEHVAPGLAITPATEDNKLHGGWIITHTPSGQLVFPISGCLTCVRYATRWLTASGIDWTRANDVVTADPDVKQAVLDFACTVDDTCDGPDCGGVADTMPEAA
ncbi:hypothetical protein OG989_04255 [Micromonospora sp. NBC_01740]|uniref:hypothetical protein n=1 Tax=Micromonospora sp. NBC_01740 TaxID=2975986 RepID=UPI002E14F0DE|nr:hypothetical protein OG989_04255 [Micromonospora sp. NBC_01740]